MRDVGRDIRKAYYTVLNESVFIEGAPIPIVDEKLDQQISEHDLYMLIGGQTENGTDNKTHWVREVDLVITVINRRKATNTKTVIEDISNQIMQIVFPAKNQTSISVASPFHLSYAKLLNPGEYGFFKNDTTGIFQISKQLTFRNRITQ
jgi:hypothetical protein